MMSNTCGWSSCVRQGRFADRNMDPIVSSEFRKNRRAGTVRYRQNADLLGASVAVGVLQDFHAVTPVSGRLPRIFETFRDPNAPAIVECHRLGIDDSGSLATSST